MRKIGRMIVLAAAAVLMMCTFTGCTHYCSYGGCMREVEHEGDRCSAHEGLENDPYYGIPDEWK